MTLDQVAEINARLAAASVSTSDLGLEAPVGVLAEIVLEGSPTFGYLWARLRAGGEEAGRVLLHTDQLQAISRALHLPHHHWGL
jgi:hypothetical protein